MPDLSKVTITTQRLKLVPISMEYKHDIFREFNAEVTAQMISSPSKNISETENYIKSRMTGNDRSIAILHQTTDEFLGCVGLYKINEKIPELGIWIKKSAQGHGYGREAVTGVKHWADQNLEYEYLSYPCAVDNPASRRIPESLGGKVIAEFDLDIQGTMQPCVEYHIPKQ